MQIKLDRINSVNKLLANGKVRTYHYHRDTGKRIEGEPGTLAFYAAYEKAAQRDEVSADTVNSLLLSYQGSLEFRQLTRRSQQQYRTMIGPISDKWGNWELEAMQDKSIRGDVLQWRDEIAKSGRLATAQHTINMMKTIFNWGEQRGIIEYNRLRRISNIYRPDRSECVWTRDQIAKLFSVACDHTKHAICLALFTLQRQGDLLKLTWPRGESIPVKQQKTHSPVMIPVFGTFADFLQMVPRNGETILTTGRQRPWKISNFQAHWNRTLANAGLANADLHFHDLRGTAITCLADHGATDAEIAALSGHIIPGSNKAMKGYRARTATQARNAMAKLQSSWIGELPTILQTA